MLVLGSAGMGVQTAANYPPSLGTGCSLGPTVNYPGVLNLQIYNATALVRLYILDDPTGAVRGWHPLPEVALPPQAVIYTNVVGFDAKDLTSGTHATILATLTESDRDPVTPGGVQLTGTLSAGGQVGTGGRLTGIVNANGTIAGGTGFTVAHAGTGLYNVTFTAAFAQIPVMLITLLTDPQVGGSAIVGGVVALSTAGATVHWTIVGAPDQDVPWMFSANNVS